VELIEDGEVSPYFHEVLAPGDQVELRGPIGGPFTWRGEMGGPLLLIAGGSGIVPIMSMLRHRAISAPEVPALLLYSARAPEDVIYRDELERMAEASGSFQLVYTFTRRRRDGWNGFTRRVDHAMLADVSSRLPDVGRAYVCGPTPFVETAASGLVETGVPAEVIRTERFGPTGG
ncbi:MAG: oxidoreductase, partial [Chloroflexota bacterium]